MKPLTEQDIRTSFINCSKGEAKRISLPRDLDRRPWDDLDFLGWRDPGAPDRSYLVTERADRPCAARPDSAVSCTAACARCASRRTGATGSR